MAGIDTGDFGAFLAGEPVLAVQGEGRQSDWLGSIQRRLATRQEVQLNV